MNAHEANDLRRMIAQFYTDAEFARTTREHYALHASSAIATADELITRTFGRYLPDAYVCTYCGGLLTEGTVTGYVHADDGDRVAPTPGDYVSSHHNAAGTFVMSCDVMPAAEYDIALEGGSRD